MWEDLRAKLAWQRFGDIELLEDERSAHVLAYSPATLMSLAGYAYLVQAYHVEIACSNSTIQGQVCEQLRDFVLGGIRFGKLHNDLRYPSFSERYQSYSLLSVGRQDADITLAPD